MAATPARRLTSGAEVAGYLGGTLALAAAIALGAQLWPLLEPWAQAAILALGAGALLAAGAWARRGAEDPAADRLSGVLWLLAILPAAGAVGVTGADVARLEESAVAVATSGAMLVLTGMLWRARRRALQLLALHGAAIALLLSTLSLADRPPWELSGLPLWALGVGAALLAWGGVTTPERSGLVLGALTALAGCQALAFTYTAQGLLLGLVTAALLLVLARPVDEALLAGGGVLGLALFTPQLLNHWFPDSVGPPAALLVGGVVLLAGALATIRSGRPDAA